jgi:hypothetical protein
MFWRELSTIYPDSLVLLSLRDSADTWWQSIEATILPVARMAMLPGWTQGRGLLTLFERFTQNPQWDEPHILKAAYEQHNAAVRAAIPAHRLIEWQVGDGWLPICQALGLPVPNSPFPYTNRREEWG